MKEFQKLETPQLIELDDEKKFVIVTEIDLSEMKNHLIFMRGKSYNYEIGQVIEGKLVEIQYSVTEDGYCRIDENGNFID